LSGGMTEKLFDIPIDSPLTEIKREAISKFIVENAHRFPMKIEHTWNNEAQPILSLVTKPVTWVARFHDQKVEVFGIGPFWAAKLLTKNRRQEIREHIESVLQHAGFVTASPTQA
jgi:hypothetical protein